MKTTSGLYNMSNSILLIAFKFPPYAGIASKRWAKFSKYLVRKGFVVHVVTVDWRKGEENTWCEDIQSPGIVIHKIPSLGFHNIVTYQFKNNVSGNLLRIGRAGLVRFRRLFYDIDEAQFWGYVLLPYCKKLIKKEGIQNIIATGQPFMANYWASRLSVDTRVNLINDFRDAWNEGPIKKYFLFRQKSIEKQLFALENCSYITVVSKGMKRQLLDHFDIQDHNKIRVLYNGYDEDDFSDVGPRRRNSRFTISYAGGISFGRQECFQAFLKQMEHLVQTGQIHKDKVVINLYGGYYDKITALYPGLADIVHSGGYVMPAEAINALYNSDLSLVFNSERLPFALSSKLFEQLRMGMPMLAITPQGDISDICSQFPVGVFTQDQESQICDYILDIYNGWLTHRPVDGGYEWETINQYSYSTQVALLEELLSSAHG